MSGVALEIDGHVAVVRLDRADKRNALDLAMFDALAARVSELEKSRHVRAVVLTGAGDAFCAGIDVSVLAGDGPRDLAARMQPREGSPANAFQAAAWAWRTLPMPVICALHGAAFGAGLQLALGADIRVAAPSTQLSIMEVRWGLVPDMGLSVTGRGRVATDVLLELAWTGRVIDAVEGHRVGLVTTLHDDPLATALALARDLGQRSPDAVRGIKALLGADPAESAHAALSREARIQSDLLGKPNQREAVRANVEGRLPRFLD